MTEDRKVGNFSPPGSQKQSKDLRLKVIAGHGLAKKDIFGLNHPYVRIKLIDRNGEKVGESMRTKTKKRTLHPQWKEEFIFQVIPDEHRLVLEVFNVNIFTGDNFLGMVELSLSEAKTVFLVMIC